MLETICSQGKPKARLDPLSKWWILFNSRKSILRKTSLLRDSLHLFIPLLA